MGEIFALTIIMLAVYGPFTALMGVMIWKLAQVFIEEAQGNG